MYVRMCICMYTLYVGIYVYIKIVHVCMYLCMYVWMCVCLCDRSVIERLLSAGQKRCSDTRVHILMRVSALNNFYGVFSAINLKPF